MNNQKIVKAGNRKNRDMQANLAGSYSFDDFSDHIIASSINGQALPVSTVDVANIIRTKKTELLAYNIATQTLLTPVKASTGLDISGDQTDGDGYELTLQNPNYSDSPFTFTVGSEKIGAFIEAKFSISDVSDVELEVGFRKLADWAAARSSYTDYASLFMDNGNLKSVTRVNTGTESAVDTTEDVADAGVLTVRVTVDTEGKVKFYASVSSTADLDEVVVSQDFTFDDGDVIIPYIRNLMDGDGTASVIMQSLECGYLN